MTKEKDAEDLAWHQKEFMERKSFAYTVMDCEEERCLGCVYIFSSRKKSFDADIIMWVRQSEFKNDLDEYLFKLVQEWVKSVWPFEHVAYPGREISWEEYGKLS